MVVNFIFSGSCFFGFFCKKVDLSSTFPLCTVSLFFVLHFTYLGVRTHPLSTGLIVLCNFCRPLKFCPRFANRWYPGASDQFCRDNVNWR